MCMVFISCSVVLCLLCRVALCCNPLCCLFCCMALYCDLLCRVCFVALRCVVLRSVVSPLCNVSVELHCVVIRCVVLHCDPLNFVALCCVALLTSSPFLVFRLC